MEWTVLIGDEFEPEFLELPNDVHDEILAMALLLQQFGPNLGRPHVDTLKDSRHANMKELRFDAANGVWRTLSPSTPSAEPFCSLRGTSRAAVKSGSIGS